MKNKFIIYLSLALFFGFITAHAFYTEYQKSINNTKYNAYLIQIGSYKGDDLEINTDKYLVLKEDGVYNVYAGITTNLSNASKIKKLYEAQQIHSYIKPTVIDNIEFISNLEQYDILLSEVDDEDNLISINDVIISSYEEMVLEK